MNDEAIRTSVTGTACQRFSSVGGGGQGYEYIHLVTHGTTIPSSAYGSVFYLATGFHGLHVIGGLVAFIYLLARTTMTKFTPAQATASIVVSYYWHFVDIVWIALFSTIYFVR